MENGFRLGIDSIFVCALRSFGGGVPVRDGASRCGTGRPGASDPALVARYALAPAVTNHWCRARDLPRDPTRDPT